MNFRNNPPTKEQLHICQLAATGKNLLIEAGAGCAKTSTGKYIADAIPSKTILSIFFNKANSDEGMQASDRPTNMFYSTIHSLCYRKVMNEGYKRKLNNFLLYEDIEPSLLEKLLLNPEAYASRKEYESELNKLKRVTLDCIKLWQQSDASDIFKFVKALPSKQLGCVLKENSSGAIEDLELTILITEAEEMLRRRCIAETCYKLWVTMIDSTHVAKITHDTYVKLFQLFDYKIEEFYSVADKQYKKVDLLLLDEFQDSSAVTLSIFKSQTHLQLIACGDTNQCLVEGTIVDGKPIETFKVGDLIPTVIKGVKHVSVITDIFKKTIAEEVITLTTKSGRVLTSTKTHTHIVESMQQKHDYLVYLMYKQGYGFRVGSTKDFRQRQSSERCDRAWVIRVLEDNPVEARVFEQVTAFTYGIPTLIYVNREGKDAFTDAYYKEVFSKIDSTTGALRLLEDCGLSFDRPHFLPQATTSDRMTLTITTMGDVRGRSILHKLSVFLSDEQASEFGAKFPTYSIRVSKKGREGYRIENSTRDMQVCFNLLKDLQTCFPHVEVKELIAVTETRSLQLKLASDLHIGMSVQVETATGFELDEIVSIQKHFYEGFVYDFNVKDTHNFIANGITTHNCIYTWRGAIGDAKAFKGWQQATLSESFRFHQGIADMANYVLEHRDTKLRLIGRGLSKGTGQTAILCRTNAKVLGIVFHALLEEKKVYCVAKLDDMYSMMYHVQAVLNEDKPKFPHSSLKNFDTIEKMEQAIASNQELQSLVKLSQEISKRGGGLHKGIQYLKSNLCKKQEEAELIVSTIHGFKGLGATHVVIADDFLVEKEDPEEMGDIIRKMWQSDSMTSLLYVAITRGMLTVQLPSYLRGEFPC